jgi:N-acetylneuraminate synthase
MLFAQNNSANDERCYIAYTAAGKIEAQLANTAGANAIKFQTYKPSTMTLDIDEFRVSSDHALWGGRKLFELYGEAFTPWEWHKELFELCRSIGVIPFSSPFDLTAVEFLESLNAPMYKIASLETGDHRLIRAVAETHKPLIISTGATEMSEIEDLVGVVEKAGNSDLTLLVCTSSYPAKPIDAHLKRMVTLRSHFGVKVGISDHTLGIGVSVAAIALGATVIEKHLTLCRSDGGADGAFSMEPEEFADLVVQGKNAKASLGKPEWKVQDSEKESRRLRRSLYITQDVKAGDIVTELNVRAIRPGDGAKPKFLPEILGQKFNGDFPIGTPLSLNYISN